jgi:hypothetical protein
MLILFAMMVPSSLIAQNLGQVIVPGTAVIFDPDSVLSAPELASLSGGSNFAPGALSATPAVKIASFPAAHGQVITLSASGAIDCCGGTPPMDPPDGYLPDVNISGIGSISGYNGPGFALLGVFTNGNPSGAAPADYDYSNGTNQSSFAPSLNQVFYIGDGLTGTGSGPSQSFLVPDTATELWLGIADTDDYGNGPPGGYDNNTGSFAVAGELAESLRFVPVTPCRVADTRNATGAFGGPELAAAATRTFNVPQSACGIPASAVAYSLNVTVVPIASLGYLSIWPAGEAQPTVSTLNSTDGRVKANATITPAGVSGGVSVYASDATQVILDIDGYFVPAGTSASGLEFYPLTPCRIADTRNPTGALGGPSLAANSGRAFPVQSSACGIPSTAKAYSLNMTAVPHGSLGYLTAWPSGEAQPVVSTLNATTGVVTANAAIVPAGTSGDVSIVVSDAADVILDVNGYFAPPASGGLSLYTVTPCRVIDTRNGVGAFDGMLAVPVPASTCAPPATAQAYVLNATVVPTVSLSYLTLWAAGGAQPVVSTLNATDGAVTSNMAIVPTSNGTVDAFATDSTNLLLDLSSYFAP